MKLLPELETTNREYMEQHGILFSRWKSESNTVNEWREVKALDMVAHVTRAKDDIHSLNSMIKVLESSLEQALAPR